MDLVYGARIENGEDKREDKLDGSKQRGEVEVGQLQGTDVNFHFEGGELRAAEQEDDAETGEVKHEDEQGSGKQRRAQNREDGIFPDMERVRAEDTGGGF